MDPRGLIVALLPALLFCTGEGPGEETSLGAPEEEHAPEDPFASVRERMLQDDLGRRGIVDPAVLAAMSRVPRQRFVPDTLASMAYADRPLPIGSGQTISQPYIVALMTELAGLEPGDRVLEVGTGSGYQAAVLAEIVSRVYSIEILGELSRSAAQLLTELGYDNVETRIGDGYGGWKEEAPFDAILVTAAPPEVPAPLLEQLAVGARLVIPVGRSFQELLVIERGESGYERRRSIPVRFVPMTGEAQRKD